MPRTGLQRLLPLFLRCCHSGILPGLLTERARVRPCADMRFGRLAVILDSVCLAAICMISAAELNGAPTRCVSDSKLEMSASSLKVCAWEPSLSAANHAAPPSHTCPRGCLWLPRY